MADSYTTFLNMTKPEVGSSTDTWGGKLNVDLDTLDALFAPTGVGTSVGLNVGTGKTLTVAGTAVISGTLAVTGSVAVEADTFEITDASDLSKIAKFDASGISTATIRTFAFPNASDTLAVLAAAQTFTNKTLTAPVIATIVNTGTLTLPTSTDTLVGRATTDTLTNKTLTDAVVGTQTAGDNSTKAASTAYVDLTRVGAQFTDSLGAAVPFTDTTTYFPGPAVAQGATGIFLAIGTISAGNGNPANIVAKLWDGTNVKASPIGAAPAAGYVSIAVSGIFVDPPGNIRIDVRNTSDPSGAIIADAVGLGLDSTLTVIRIA